jgi:hypothetical protein
VGRKLPLDDWLATTLRERGDMEIFRRALLAAVTVMCVISIAASCYLALSYTILKGLGDIRPLMPLALFVAQGAVTLVALNTILSGLSIDLFALAGALAITWLGYSMVERTLSGPHFEGYALVLGTVGVLQGMLTLVLFFWGPAGAPGSPNGENPCVRIGSSLHRKARSHRAGSSIGRAADS